MDSPLPAPPPTSESARRLSYSDKNGPPPPHDVGRGRGERSSAGAPSPPPGAREAASAWRQIVRDVLANQPKQTHAQQQPRPPRPPQQHPPHARQRSASLSGAAPPPSSEWRVTFHEGSESDSEPDEPAGPRTPARALTPASTGAAAATAAPQVSPPRSSLSRPPSLAAKPSSILRQHSSHSLQALNFLPEGLSEEEVRRRYPSLTPADLDDIGGFLDLDASDPSAWSYASLFSWSAEKLDLLLTAIQPDHLTLIAHRSMTEKITSRPLDVAFRNLHCRQAGQTKLRGLSGYCRPGMMVAVWGAPDSGVSTFLALLAGCYRDSGRNADVDLTGELLLNGAPLRWHRKRRQIGYVTKEAENFAQLTVEQTLYFSARLRLPRLPERILRFRVGLVCKLLGLSHLRDSAVGSASVRGLSGGERKRVAYACELIVGYSLILCDQPTDGLDQPSALSLMQNFKLTCGAGRSMMTSLATASVDLFELFDFLLLLSKGACIYFGPRVSVMDYLRAQGFAPPAASDPAERMAVPDFLQALSASPERFWTAALPIAVRPRPCPWIAEHFAFFQDPAVLRSLSKQRDKKRKKNASDKAPRYQQFLLEVDVRKLARFDSTDASDHNDSISDAYAGSGGGRANGGGGGGGSDDGQGGDIEMGQLRTRQPSAPAHAYAASDDSDHAQQARVQTANRRRAWKRLLKGWRASDLNADCAYVLDFELQPIQPNLLPDAPPDSTVSGPTSGKLDDGSTVGRNHASTSPPRPSSALSDVVSPEPRSGSGGDGAPSKRPFSPQRPTFLTQVWLCLVRQSVFVYRNPGLWLYNWLKTLVLALVVGSLFYQLGSDALRDVRPRFGMLYFLVTFYGNSAIQMISVLLSSRSVVQWETFAGYYHPTAYSVALTIVFIPVAIIEMFLLVIVLYPLSGLSGGVGSANFFYMWLQMTLSSLAGRGWILLFTTFLPTQALANIVAPVFNLLVSSFCGYLNPKSNIPSGWIWMYYLSYYTYVFRGLSLNEFAGLSFECPAGDSCDVETGADALLLYDIDYADPVRQKWYDCAILFGFYVGFQTLAALALLTRRYTPRDDSATPDFGESVSSPSKAALLPASASAASADNESALLLSVPPEHHVLSFLNLSYSVPVPVKHSSRGKLASAFSPEMEERHLLNGISGVVATGQLIALMGTSGAGKSTLLDCLAQKKTVGTLSGSILWDGQPLPSNFTRLVGYVEQFDSLSPQSTIRETLFFSGRLRLSPHLSDADIDARVSRMLDTLELTPLMDARIGAVETGNLLAPEVRKKVAIAVELMAEPSVLFLDEPTTGLDSMSSLLLARLLRKLSRRLLVVCTIHQPSNAVLKQFDVLLLVKPPGTLAFYGPFDLAARFFQQLPQRFPAQLGGVHLPVPGPTDNLADVVLGALKIVSKLEGEASQTKDGRSAAPSFSCRAAFLDSSYSQPLLRALAHVHGDEALVEAGLPAPDAAPTQAEPSPGSSGLAPPLPLTAGEHKDADRTLVDFTIPLPPRTMLLADKKQKDADGSDAGAASLHSRLLTQSYAFRELLRRFAVSTVRSRRSFGLRFFTCLVYGLVTGTLFYQLGSDQKDAASRISFIYFAARFSLFSGNLKLPGVFSTRVMLFRETTTRMYSPLAYAAARSVADLPWIAIEMLVFSVIVYFFSGLQSDGPLFGWFYLVMLLDRLISIGFIELVGALTPTIELAQSLQTAINMLFMLFSGFFIAVQAMPRAWRWMTRLSPYYYVIRFLANNEYTRIDEFQCDQQARVAVPPQYDTCPVSPAMDQLGTKCPLECGAELLQQYSIPQTQGYLYQDLGILILFAFAYPILAALALRFVNFIRR